MMLVSRLPSSLILGVLTLVTLSCGGDSTGPAQQQLPTLELYTNPSGVSRRAGDSLFITITASDSTPERIQPLSYTKITVSGAITLIDSASANGASRLQRSILLHLPVTAMVTTTLSISAEAVALTGERIASTLPLISVTDTGAAPKVSGSLTTTHTSNGAAPHDTVKLSIIASDRGNLAYVGYRLGAPANAADSVATTTHADTLALSLVVPSSWTGVSSATVFARDSAGNLTTFDLGSLTVLTRSRRPVVSVALPTPVYDVAYDSKRNFLYMSVPSLEQVAVLSLDNMTFATPYTFGATTLGIDVTMGQDSLLVAMEDTNDIAIIDLPTGAPSLLRVSVDTVAGEPLFAVNVRATIGAKALMSLGIAQGGIGGALVVADLATGGYGTLTRNTYSADQVAVSGNGARAIALADYACCPEVAYIFDAAGDSLRASKNTVSRAGYLVSADHAGNTFLIGSFVYDASLNQVGSFPDREFVAGPSLISADGKSAYFTTSTGIVQLRISDGATIDSFTLGEAPNRMWLSRDGLTIFARTDSQRMYVVDLW